VNALNPRANALLNEIKVGVRPLPPMWELAGIQTVDWEPGKIRLTASADAKHVNAFGAVHGGYAATLLDTALGLTVFIAIDEEARHTTVDLAVKIVRPVPLHERLFVETALIHVSRRIGVSQGTLQNETGKVYAHGTTTCHIKQP
jgi:uncharacterized protein (TIGR00369 family)